MKNRIFYLLGLDTIIMEQIIKRNPLFFAFFFPAITDGVVTLVGQRSVYWSNSSIASDASPVYYFLTISSWLF